MLLGISMKKELKMGGTEAQRILLPNLKGYIAVNIELEIELGFMLLNRIRWQGNLQRRKGQTST